MHPPVLRRRAADRLLEQIGVPLREGGEAGRVGRLLGRIGDAFYPQVVVKQPPAASRRADHHRRRRGEGKHTDRLVDARRPAGAAKQGPPWWAGALVALIGLGFFGLALMMAITRRRMQRGGTGKGGKSGSFLVVG